MRTSLLIKLRRKIPLEKRGNEYRTKQYFYGWDGMGWNYTEWANFETAIQIRRDSILKYANAFYKKPKQIIN